VVSGPEDPRPAADWDAFRAARERFFSRARPEAMTEPPPSICPETLPQEWTAEGDEDGGAAEVFGA
jgi:hypothetical protein